MAKKKNTRINNKSLQRFKTHNELEISARTHSDGY